MNVDELSRLLQPSILDHTESTQSFRRRPAQNINTELPKQNMNRGAIDERSTSESAQPPRQSRLRRPAQNPLRIQPTSNSEREHFSLEPNTARTPVTPFPRVSEIPSPPTRQSFIDTPTPMTPQTPSVLYQSPFRSPSYAPATGPANSPSLSIHMLPGPAVRTFSEPLETLTLGHRQRSPPLQSRTSGQRSPSRLRERQLRVLTSPAAMLRAARDPPVLIIPGISTLTCRTSPSFATNAAYSTDQTKPY
jgi:hypothetical protein